MMTYNHAYYGRLIENYGFRKSQDLFAFWGPVDMVYKLDKKLLSSRRNRRRGSTFSSARSTSRDSTRTFNCF